MSSFYKMEPAAWDFGTADLTLEQEAAYLRIVNARRGRLSRPWLRPEKSRSRAVGSATKKPFQIWFVVGS